MVRIALVLLFAASQVSQFNAYLFAGIQIMLSFVMGGQALSGSSCNGVKIAAWEPTESLTLLSLFHFSIAMKEVSHPPPSWE